MSEPSITCVVRFLPFCTSFKEPFAKRVLELRAIKFAHLLHPTRELFGTAVLVGLVGLSCVSELTQRAVSLRCCGPCYGISGCTQQRKNGKSLGSRV
jgi:hypothetical protein